MSRHKRNAKADLETLSSHARDLMTATADFSGEKVEQARRQLSDALEKGKKNYDEVRDQALSTVRLADDFISDNPYAALGIGVAVGVLIGWLLRGRRD